MIDQPNGSISTNNNSLSPQALERARLTQSQTLLPFQKSMSAAVKVSPGILQIVQQWVAQLQNGERPRTAKPLNLSPREQSKLKHLMGLSDSAPVQVAVLGMARDGKIAEGDSLVVHSDTGKEVARRVLSEDDLTKLHTPQQVPMNLLENEAKWDQFAASGTVSYEAQLSCFCPQDYNRPMQIMEDRGRIVDAKFADTGEPVPVYIKDGLLTVKERFAQLAEAYNSKAEKIEVDYDPTYGFPCSVFIDQSSMMADEEVRYTIRNVNANQ